MPNINRPSITASLLIILALLLALSSGAAAAPPGFSGGAAPTAFPPTWIVSISGLNGLVCAGDSYMQTVQWMPNPANFLSPLVGPSVILVSATHGSFDHETERPGLAVSGTALFNYTAEKPGSETLTVKVFDSQSEVVATAAASFEVKKSSYLYNLYAELDAENHEGALSLAFNFVFKSKGLLKAPDPSQPKKLEARGKTLSLETTITDFVMPECQLLTWNPGHGLGFVDATADKPPRGIGIDLKIGPPQDMTWDYHAQGVCEGGSGGPVDVSFPVNSSSDPWIEQVFPFGEGEYPVKIDMFEKGVERYNRLSGGHASYTARLSLKRLEEK